MCANRCPPQCEGGILDSTVLQKGVVQSVEWRIPNAQVAGSTPAALGFRDMVAIKGVEHALYIIHGLLLRH